MYYNRRRAGIIVSELFGGMHYAEVITVQAKRELFICFVSCSPLKLDPLGFTQTCKEC